MSFSFLNLFSKQSTKIAENSENLSGPAQIATMLQRLMDNRELLTITFASDNNYYSSAVIKVDKANSHFSLDEISPESGHHKFILEKQCFIKGQVNGVELSFRAKLSKVKKSSNIAYYEVPFPAQVNYLQRRASFRSKVSVSKRIQVSTYHTTNACTIYGNLVDISVQGVCVIFESTSMMRRGDVLKSCRIKFPAGEILTVNIDVRYVQSLANSRLRIGACFSKLDRVSKRRIGKFVRGLEREQLKLKRQ